MPPNPMLHHRAQWGWRRGPDVPKRLVVTSDGVDVPPRPPNPVEREEKRGNRVFAHGPALWIQLQRPRFFEQPVHDRPCDGL
eukprot:9152556-Pyramimonas_sp.AAC.1